MGLDQSCCNDGTKHVNGVDGMAYASHGMTRKDVEANSNWTTGIVCDAQKFDDDGRPCRTGTVWTASAHVVTAVIGSGVLSLAWSIAQLGWATGPPILFFFAIVTFYTSTLLADCYRNPGPLTGARNYNYMAAVNAHLGGFQIVVCGFIQYLNLIGTTIGYTLTASLSMVAIKRSKCLHVQGHHAPCHVSNNLYMALFGALQIMLSMIPNFDRIWWLSIVAAVMSFSYSSIGLGLSIVKTIANGRVAGSIVGVDVHVTSIAEKTWTTFQALGNIAFAYAFNIILIEIQDTLKASPPESKSIKKASLLGIAITTAYYASVGCIGYATLGNDAPGNLLTEFGFYNPYWLIDLANACIVVHLVGAYQVFAQPIFAFVETWAITRWPKSDFINHEYKISLSMKKAEPFRVNACKVLWRAIYVVFTTIVAMLLPFFNYIVGLLGAFAFWPLTVYFPVTMHIAQTNIKRWSRKWIALQTLSLGCFLVSLVAGIGSIVGIVQDLKRYTPFETHYDD